MRTNSTYQHLERDWLYPIKSGEKGFYIAAVEGDGTNYPDAGLIIGDGTDQVEFSVNCTDQIEFDYGIEALEKLTTAIQLLIKETYERRAIFLNQPKNPPTSE